MGLIISYIVTLIGHQIDTFFFIFELICFIVSISISIFQFYTRFINFEKQTIELLEKNVQAIKQNEMTIINKFVALKSTIDEKTIKSDQWKGQPEKLVKIIKDTFKRKKFKIKKIYNTTVAHYNLELKHSLEFHKEMYEILKDRIGNIEFKNLITVPDPTRLGYDKVNPKDKKKLCNLIYDSCFDIPPAPYKGAPLYSNVMVTNFLTKLAPNFPFINFTLIEYENTDKIVFYGWYATSLEKPEAKDDHGDKHEIHGYTTSKNICTLFEGVWETICYYIGEGLIKKSTNIKVTKLGTNGIKSIKEQIEKFVFDSE